MSPEPLVLDDFGGPGGWDEGAALLGLAPVGVEADKDATLTAIAAGHRRILGDVRAVSSSRFVGLEGYVASPPCQAWSQAGLRRGEDDRGACHALLERVAARDLGYREHADRIAWADPRSALVCWPLERILDLMPEWVALEEVKEVAGLWEHYARILRSFGYNVWTGVVNAADYGVPQKRRRALLLASRKRRVGPPVPTHAENPGEDLFGASLLPHVSMRDAIGWGFPEPAATITGGGSGSSSGPEPFGNADYRRRLADYVAMGDVAQSKGTIRALDEPAPTITSSMDNGNFRWVRADGARGDRLTIPEAGVLQSFRHDYPWQGTLTSQCMQVGNAVPPLLAAAALEVVSGRERCAVEKPRIGTLLEVVTV